MEENTYGIAFRFAQKIARLLLPRYLFERPPILGKPVVYVSHHQNMVGPISILAWVKYYVRTWVLAEFTDRKAAYNHYSTVTFYERYDWPKWLAKMVAWPASYIAPWVVNSADAIPVYRKSRKIIQTMKISHDTLMSGESILIFPDIDYSNDSQMTSDIYQGFLHLEKRYFKEANEHLTFVPIYSDSKEKVIRIGKEVKFTGKENFNQEQEKIARKIREELNHLAQIKNKRG